MAAALCTHTVVLFGNSVLFLGRRLGLDFNESQEPHHSINGHSVYSVQNGQSDSGKSCLVLGKLALFAEKTYRHHLELFFDEFNYIDIFKEP